MRAGCEADAASFVEDVQRLSLWPGTLEDQSAGEEPQEREGFLGIQDGVVVWGPRELPSGAGAFVAEASFLMQDGVRYESTFMQSISTGPSSLDICTLASENIAG